MTLVQTVAPAPEGVVPRYAVSVFVRRLVIAGVVMSPFSAYRMPLGGVNWNVDRMLILFASLALMANLLLGRSISRWPAVIFLGFLVSAGLSLLAPGVDLPSAKQSVPNLGYCYLVFLLVALVASQGLHAQQQLVYALAAVALIYILFTVYSLYTLFFLGQPITDLPFRDFIPLPLVAGSEHLLDVTASARRSSLPFGVPQVLATASGSLALLFVMWHRAVRRWPWILLSGLMLVVSVATISRTGVYSIFGACFIGLFAILCRREERSWIGRKLFGFGLFGSVFVGLGVYWLGTDALGEFDRLLTSMDQSTTQAHLAIRFKALNWWADAGWLNELIGTGLGNFYRFGAALKAHMSVLTLLVERGVLGVLLGYWIIAWLPVEFFLRYAKGRGNHYINATGLMVSAQLFFANLFYEVYQVPILWVLIGFLSALAWSPNDQNVSHTS